ncbi:hypothetical protein LUU34_00452100 [Aix galericulata]|nr:hypothetical protein LUU34_00452100 [Aix galericulata]
MGCWGTGALLLLPPTLLHQFPWPRGGPRTPSPPPSTPSPRPPAPSRPGRAPPDHVVPKGSFPGRTGRPGTKCTDVTSRQAGGTPGPTGPRGGSPCPRPCPSALPPPRGGPGQANVRPPSPPALPPCPAPPWAMPKAQSQAPCPQLPHPRSLLGPPAVPGGPPAALSREPPCPRAAINPARGWGLPPPPPRRWTHTGPPGAWEGTPGRGSLGTSQVPPLAPRWGGRGARHRPGPSLAVLPPPLTPPCFLCHSPQPLAPALSGRRRAARGAAVMLCPSCSN